MGVRETPLDIFHPPKISQAARTHHTSSPRPAVLSRISHMPKWVPSLTLSKSPKAVRENFFRLSPRKAGSAFYAVAWRAHFNRSLAVTAASPSFLSHFHRFPANRAHFGTMSDSGRVVYLEDLEAPTKEEATGGGKETKSSTAAVATATVVATKNASEKKETTKTAVKRQRTLMDMFSSGSSSGGTLPNAKKIKLDKSGSSTSITDNSKASGNVAPRTLNSIPFSPSEFVASLSDEEKRLLALEVESMGKSW